MAKKDAIQLTNDIMDEIETYLHTYAITYCKEAEKELTKTARCAIEQFYKDYGPNNGKPWFYDRTDDLKKNSISSYFHDNGSRVYGGVRINADEMSPYKNGRDSYRDPFDVVKWAWGEGWHGHPSVNIQTTAPLEIVKDKMKDQGFLSDLDKKAKDAAGKQSYKYLKRFFNI